MTITLAQANAIIAAALKKGRDLRLKPISVAVLDPGGHLVAFQREDGSSNLRPQIAMGKASGALAIGVSSRKIGEMAAERPTFIAAVSQIATGGLGARGRRRAHRGQGGGPDRRGRRHRDIRQ